MRRGRLMRISAIAGVVFCALTFEAFANSAGGGGTAPCVVATPGRGAVPIIAVAAVTIQNMYLLEDVPGTYLGNPVTVDLTLRVWKPALRFPLVFQAFRLELKEVPIENFLSNEALACLFLDPGDPATNPYFDAVSGFVQAIAKFLGLPPVTRFVITSKSIRNTEPVPTHDQQVCTAVELDPVTGLPTCTAGSPNASSVADVVFFTR